MSEYSNLWQCNLYLSSPFTFLRYAVNQSTGQTEAPHLRSGWWFEPTPLKNDGVSNSWDDEIPNMIWESHDLDSMVPVTNQISFDILQNQN